MSPKFNLKNKKPNFRSIEAFELHIGLENGCFKAAAELLHLNE